MSRLWKILAALWGGLSAAILVAATVPASVAMTNLASWAKLIGLTALANGLLSHTSDKMAQAVAIANIALLLLLAILIRFLNKRKRDRQGAGHQFSDVYSGAMIITLLILSVFISTLLIFGTPKNASLASQPSKVVDVHKVTDRTLPPPSPDRTRETPPKPAQYASTRPVARKHKRDAITSIPSHSVERASPTSTPQTLPTSPKADCNVSSANQSGGVTACSITTVNQ